MDQKKLFVSPMLALIVDVNPLYGILLKWKWSAKLSTYPCLKLNFKVIITCKKTEKWNKDLKELSLSVIYGKKARTSLATGEQAEKRKRKNRRTLHIT